MKHPTFAAPVAFALTSLLIGPAAIGLPGTANATSFDCRKAAKPNEFAVCEDANLGRIERSFASEYLQRMGRLRAERRNGERRRFRSEHRRNIRRAEACGYSGQCIYRVYVNALARYRNLD